MMYQINYCADEFVSGAIYILDRYAVYYEHQESLGRPILSLGDWLIMNQKWQEKFDKYIEGGISGEEFDCQDTWDMEYMLGA